jgi:hypothetical protein
LKIEWILKNMGMYVLNIDERPQLIPLPNKIMGIEKKFINGKEEEISVLTWPYRAGNHIPFDLQEIINEKITTKYNLDINAIRSLTGEVKQQLYPKGGGEKYVYKERKAYGPYDSFDRIDICTPKTYDRINGNKYARRYRLAITGESKKTEVQEQICLNKNSKIHVLIVFKKCHDFLMMQYVKVLVNRTMYNEQYNDILFNEIFCDEPPVDIPDSQLTAFSLEGQYDMGSADGPRTYANVGEEEPTKINSGGKSKLKRRTKRLKTRKNKTRKNKTRKNKIQKKTTKRTRRN